MGSSTYSVKAFSLQSLHQAWKLAEEQVEAARKAAQDADDRLSQALLTEAILKDRYDEASNLHWEGKWDGPVQDAPLSPP
jgi:hypothetical protein